MASSLATLVIFALVVLGVAAVCRFLRRRLGAPEIAGFALLTVLFFFPGFFRGRTILPVDHAMLLSPWAHMGTATRYNANMNDVVTQFAPWAKAVRMAWKEGSLPLRDRWNGGGTPLAANGGSAAFSPFTFLMFPVTLWAAFNLLAAVKVFLALAGTSLWLRELRLSRGAAAFGAVLFALSFCMVPWLLFTPTAVIALFPWALFAIELSRDEDVRTRASVLLGLVFFVWPLCGHPESIVVCALFTAIWLSVRFVRKDLPEAGAVLPPLALATLAALGLSAFITIPEALAIASSNRVPIAEAFRRALPHSAIPHLPYWPGGFVTSLFPRAFGDAIDSPMLPGVPGAFTELTLGFIGLVGAAAVILALRPGSRRPRAEIALFVPLLLGLAIATGTWPFYDLVTRLPVLRLMFVLRYLSWVAFAGAAIAAFEIDRLAGDAGRDRRAALAAFVPVGVLAGLAFGVHRWLAPMHAQAGGTASQRNALVAAFAALAAVGFIAAAVAANPPLARFLPLAFAFAASAELLYQGGRIFRFEPPRGLFPDTPLITFLRSRPAPFRVGGDGAVLFPNSNVFAGVEDIRTHDPVERADYVAFLDRAAGYSPAEYFKHIRNWNAPELDLLNLRYLAGEPGQVFQSPRWNRVYEGTDGVVYENADALDRVFAQSRIPTAMRHSPDGFEISRYSESTNAISFRALVPPGGTVPAVVSVVQDGGWSAADEQSRPIPVSKAADVLLGIRLPPGEHTIRLRYRPPGFMSGAWISAATAVLVGVWAVASRRRRQRTPPAAAPALS